MKPNDLEELMKHMKELEQLHDITEAEAVLLGDMVIAVRSVGYSPKLTLKLLKVITALMEVSIDYKKEKK